MPVNPNRIRTDELPPKFTDAERAAHRWLLGCAITPWLVDLRTKEVNDGERRWRSLIEFARHHGYEA